MTGVQTCALPIFELSIFVPAADAGIDAAIPTRTRTYVERVAYDRDENRTATFPQFFSNREDKLSKYGAQSGMTSCFSDGFSYLALLVQNLYTVQSTVGGRGY